MEDDKTKKAESVGKFLDSFMEKDKHSPNSRKPDSDFKIEKINRVQVSAKSNENTELVIENNSAELLKEQEELKILQFDDTTPEKTVKKETIAEKPPQTKGKDPETVKELKPEIRNAVSKILETVPKEEVKKLLEEMKSDREAVVNNRQEAFGDLNEKDKAVLKDKLDQWEVSREISEVNASVIISWLNKTIAN